MKFDRPLRRNAAHGLAFDESTPGQRGRWVKFAVFGWPVCPFPFSSSTMTCTSTSLPFSSPNTKFHGRASSALTLYIFALRALRGALGRVFLQSQYPSPCETWFAPQGGHQHPIRHQSTPRRPSRASFCRNQEHRLKSFAHGSMKRSLAPCFRFRR